MCQWAFTDFRVRVFNRGNHTNFGRFIDSLPDGRNVDDINQNADALVMHADIIELH